MQSISFSIVAGFIVWAALIICSEACEQDSLADQDLCSAHQNTFVGYVTWMQHIHKEILTHASAAIEELLHVPVVLWLTSGSDQFSDITVIQDQEHASRCT